MLPERVWRIGHVSAPLSFPPSNVRLYAGRFDDPEHEYGTLYCSESSLTCIREVLADLRPSMEYRATFEKQFGDSPFVPAGVVSWSFRQSRALAPAHVVVEGDVIDLTQEETLRKLESHHAALLADHGFQHLDIAEMLAKTRSLTQAISRSLYNQGIAAIRYPSHLDYTPCWAIFEGRAHLETDGYAQLLTEDIPEILQVCSDYSLGLRRIAIGIEQEVEIMLRISQLKEVTSSLQDRERKILEKMTSLKREVELYAFELSKLVEEHDLVMRTYCDEYNKAKIDSDLSRQSNSMKWMIQASQEMLDLTKGFARYVEGFRKNVEGIESLRKVYLAERTILIEQIVTLRNRAESAHASYSTRVEIDRLLSEAQGTSTF